MKSNILLSSVLKVYLIWEKQEANSSRNWLILWHTWHISAIWNSVYSIGSDAYYVPHLYTIWARYVSPNAGLSLAQISETQSDL